MDHDLPDYSALTPDLLAETCRAAMAECDAAVAAVAAIPAAERDFANTVLALEEAEEAVVKASGAWAFLSYTSPDDALRQTAREWEEKLGKYQVGLGFDEEQYRAVKEFAGTGAAAALTGEEARLLERVLRDYRRNGFELSGGERAGLRALFDELVEIGSRFEQEIAEWDDGIEVDRADLAGLPDAFVAGLERAGERYRVTLDYPQYVPFMANARSSALRRELMAKNQCKGGPRNVARLERAIAVRAEIARILGYDSWAAYAVEPRMAGRPEAVTAFLDDLRSKVAVKAAADLAEYADANEAAVGSRDVQPWDYDFALNRLKRTRFAVDDLRIAEYFPLDACLDGLFGVMRDVLGVRFTERPDVPVWHPDVRAFDVTDVTDAAGSGGAEDGGGGREGGEPFARFFMDLFPRPNKFKHAAAFSLQRARRRADGGYQRPVSAIVANFTEPAAGQPSLLRHSEVVTLFHEFGHVLHGTLTRTERGRFAGTATERDFVEAPSQMLEHWCWEPAVLNRFARHHETGEPLPKELLEGMIAAKQAGSGVATMRQIFFATLDFAYHSPGFGGDTTAALRDVHALHGIPYLAGTHFQSGFGHLFGYDAGYYGYLWSRVLGDDMYTRFAAAGALDPATGDRYRRLVLERGGSADGDRMVREFLEREPDNAAFLRELGLERS
ncbi:M3 family metallopeptidase [Streptomyces sp. SL13]|uniref:M3 family metallopeptidase n=1 Tax=Streptantibioticus silvisoli TaxID=2705255 RepID=A0AA90KFE9_9ACTN|nr:M3 family metallopeptidase [Streptantibioticus silvisoli]MDI5969195.1 M3 family metallopeptidase [Streptantibioticus silvisoli]